VMLIDGVCQFCRAPDFKSKLLMSGSHCQGVLTDSNQQYRHLQGTKNRCLVGLSGGADSSHLVMRLVEDLNIQPLLVHVDAGWNTRAALDNIRNIVEYYRLDLEVIVVDWSAQRELHLAFLNSGISNQDIPQDLALFSNLYKFSFLSGINNIFSGANLSTEGISRPLEFFYFASDMTLNHDICRDRKVWSRLTSYDTLEQRLLLFLRRTKFYSPLLYWHYRKIDAVVTMQKRFRYKGFAEKHYESLFTMFFEAYYLRERYSYDVRELDYSSLVLSGQMSRSEALDRLEEPPLSRVETTRLLSLIANQLEISLTELDKLIRLPHKNISAYRNKSTLFKGLTSLRSMLGYTRYFGRE
jgi:hypothetical protein